jgi:hypothetical protein
VCSAPAGYIHTHTAAPYFGVVGKKKKTSFFFYLILKICIVNNRKKFKTARRFQDTHTSTLVGCYINQYIYLFFIKDKEEKEGNQKNQ